MEAETTEKTQILVDKKLIKVLLVEDDAIDSQLVKQLLASCSQPVEFTAESVESLSEAIECIGGRNYDIVLLDLGLPDSSGVETVRKVSEINPHVPIIVLTGLHDEETGLLAIENGATDYLMKGPLLENILVRTVLYALERMKRDKLILDTNRRLQETSQELLRAKQDLENKNEALEEAHKELESRVEQRTAELSETNELLKKEIAERTQVENALRGSEANLHKVIVGNPDGIIIVEKNGIVRFVNPAAESLFGRKVEELVGETFGFPMVLDEATEIEIIHRPEGITVAEMRMVEMDWEGKRAYLASLHDITERKEAEEKIKETMAIKSEFISMASHELRTPLTAIKEGIRLVIQEQTGELNDEQKEFLEIVERNVVRLARLINDILDFQKLESGRLDVDIQENDMNEIVEEIKETMTSLSNEKGLNLITELDGTIPRIKFDRDKITQVLTNIVNNAITFTEQGSVTISTNKGDNVIEVSVSDTGPGIKKEDLPKLFNEFEQLARGSERKTGGSGLGLAISRKIIKKHNAKIWAESEPGKGTTFHFVLPIKERRSNERD